MNDEPTQPATATEIEAPAPPAVGEFQCNRCSASFGTAQALRMHQVRMHTRKGIEGARLGGQAAARAKRDRNRSEAISIAMRDSWSRRRGKGQHHRQTREEALEVRREAQRRQRAEWYAQGLNSHGQPYKGGQPKLRGSRRSVARSGTRMTLAQRREAMRERNRIMREANISHGLTSKGTPRKRGVYQSRRPKNQRAYQQKYYWRHRAEQGHPVPPDKQHLLMDYDNGARPNEKSATAALRLPKEQPAPAKASRHVTFCPVCGTNIQNVQTAVNFGGD